MGNIFPGRNCNIIHDGTDSLSVLLTTCHHSYGPLSFSRTFLGNFMSKHSLISVSAQLCDEAVLTAVAIHGIHQDETNLGQVCAVKRVC